MTTTILCGWLSRSVKRISQLCQARGLNGQLSRGTPGNAGCVTLQEAAGPRLHGHQRYRSCRG